MSKQSWDVWYQHRSWRRRRKQQLAQQPFCAICLAQDRSTAACVVDHVIPHRGDRTAFKLGELQSLCQSCHSSAKRNIELHGFDRTIGIDGMPVDPKHPCYIGKCAPVEQEPTPPPPPELIA